VRLYVDHETSVFARVRQTLQNDEFPHPPVSPYYWHVSMSFSGEFSAALAQQKETAPPAPKPAAEEPSLEETMKLIQDKLNDVGPMNFAEYIHDNASRWGRAVTNSQLASQLY
jgi:hypothetical protein